MQAQWWANGSRFEEKSAFQTPPKSAEADVGVLTNEVFGTQLHIKGLLCGG